VWIVGYFTKVERGRRREREGRDRERERYRNYIDNHSRTGFSSSG